MTYVRFEKRDRAVRHHGVFFSQTDRDSELLSCPECVFLPVGAEPPSDFRKMSGTHVNGGWTKPCERHR